MTCGEVEVGLYVLISEVEGRECSALLSRLASFPRKKTLRCNGRKMVGVYEFVRK
jgi:hypothetical protein